MLLTRWEITLLVLAEFGAEAVRRASATLARGDRRAVLYLPPIGTDQCRHREKHLQVCMAHADAQGYQVSAMAYEPAAVIGLAESGLVDVVLAAVRWRGGHLDEIEAAATSLGLLVVILRDPGEPARRRIAVDPVVAKLAALGLDAGTIADVLSAPVEHVQLALATARNTRSALGQRPERRSAPTGRPIDRTGGVRAR